jgi:hypothetical protein
VFKEAAFDLREPAAGERPGSCADAGVKSSVADFFFFFFFFYF